MRVEVVPYDPRWPQRFEMIRDQLLAALTDVEIVGVEHVGSTSVPGLAAKPVIDIDVVVTARQVDAAGAALETAGYAPLGDLGVPERWAFRPPADAVRRNVYVTVDGCLSLRNHRALRAALTADPELRRRYGDLKLALAERELDSIDEYVFEKSALVQEILARGGLTDDDLAEVAAINTPVPGIRGERAGES